MTDHRSEAALDHYWMPFTSNRYFREHPRLIASAQGAYVTTTDGQRLFDCLSGLWCVVAGHAHPKIVETVARQAATLDYCSAFQWGHPEAFKLAERLASWAPGELNRVFFCNSGSEAVDTALKIAVAYHRLRGEASRTRIIGRERGYHGVGLGGISVGGMVANRKMFAPLMINGVDHLPHTWSPQHMAFSRGQPAWGAHLADDLERIVTLHGPETIAAVIVEPIAGSTGVLIPPKGYLEKIREICTKHGIVLIFDEVITAFGRVGNSATAAEYYNVQPDIITMAKGLTSGTIPMGAVAVDKKIYDAFMTGPDNAIELFHGYTYSGHPVAAAAGLATLDIYKEEGLFERTKELAPYWEDALHALKGLPHVIDIRNTGLIGAIELEGIAGKPTARAFEAFLKAFEKGLLIRTTGDTIALSPPLIVSKAQIDEIFSILTGILKTLP